ncbi:MAG TPA: hypothetical protein VFZ68_16790 [Acidimicrobiales bacterium]
MGDVIVAVIGVVLVVVTIVVLLRQGSPGRSLSDEDATARTRSHVAERGDVVGRPGDAATEATGVAGPGEPSPHPARQAEREER